ncbi:MAG: GyrI-like domain-containing protein [Chloroflexi bacterium]|nr:MAG: GyrI-like domain-containing protein [Chloroflexota bacterium]
MGIRKVVPMHELPTVIPQFHREVFGWLGQHGVSPAGAPFIRYHTINMPSALDVEIGVPVASAVSTDGRVAESTLPAGQYAVLLYTGPYDGLMQANKALLDWAKARGLALDRQDSPNGDAFGARLRVVPDRPRRRARSREMGNRGGHSPGRPPSVPLARALRLRPPWRTC